MDRDLNGRVAVVTGASRGVGQAVAETLAEHGARVALGARRLEALAEVEHRIRGRGGEAQAFVLDVGNLDSVWTFKEQVESRLGVPTILVNAAGVFGPLRLVKDADPADWANTLQVNTLGPYYVTRAFLAGMLAAGWGRIVNMSSSASLMPPLPLHSAYAVSKTALNQFTRLLACEIRGSGVTANVIHPGDVKTDMWADVRDQAAALGPQGEVFQRWARWMEESGGDPPQKAADLVLRLVRGEFDTPNGRFLWIEDGLQPPRPSWEED